MKKLLLPLLLLLSVMTIEAQQKIKDGKRLYVSHNPNFLPIYGYYHELASLNKLYYIVDKYDDSKEIIYYLKHDANTNIASLGDNFYQEYNKDALYALVHNEGDTMFLEYHSKKDKKLIKKETYINMVLHGNQDYYKDEKLLSRDVYRNGILVRSLWYGEDSKPIKAYTFTNNQVSQMVRMYPSGKIAQKESYNNNVVHSAYYDKDGKEIAIPVSAIRKQLEDSISLVISKSHHVFSKGSAQDMRAFSYTGAVNVATDGTIQFINDYDSVTLGNFHLRSADLDLRGSEAQLSTRLLRNPLNRIISSKIITYLNSDTIPFNCIDCKTKNISYTGINGVLPEMMLYTLIVTNLIEKQICNTDWQIHPQEAVSTPLTIIYSPLYYAQTDCVIEMWEKDSIKLFADDVLCSPSFTLFQFRDTDITNEDNENVTYALVNRVDSVLTLSYYKDKERKQLMKRERYMVQSPALIVQQGLQEWYQDGKMITQEEYNNDQHISTIILNEKGEKVRKYIFEKEKVAAIEQYYAHGIRELVGNLTGESANVRYYDENNNALLFQESDNNTIREKIADYIVNNKARINKDMGYMRHQFEGDFHATKMDFDIAMLKGGQMDIYVTLDETGRVSKAFLYDFSLAVSFDNNDDKLYINIEDRLLKFQNNVNSVLSHIYEANILCTPSLVGGAPAETSTKVRIKLPL